MTEAPHLVADIGGTHARFALASGSPAGIELGPAQVWETAAYPSLEAALEAFLKVRDRPALGGVAVCAAGPVEGAGAAARIAMTNLPWQITARAISQAAGVERPFLLNDFTAVALAVPELTPADRRSIGRAGSLSAERRAGPIGIVGPGTGLGVSGLIPAPDLVSGFRENQPGPAAYSALSGEGGHVDLAAATPREAAIIAEIGRTHAHVSAERVLSGPGLETLYRALTALDGRPLDRPPAAAEIAGLARAGSDAHASETISLFCGWLGAVAGDLALTLGATGGIYLAGGILPQWGSLFDETLFRRRFEAKGRFDSYLAAIPTYLVTRADPALLGLARASLQQSCSNS